MSRSSCWHEPITPATPWRCWWGYGMQNITTGHWGFCVWYPASCVRCLGLQGSGTGDRVVSGWISKLWAKSSDWILLCCIWLLSLSQQRSSYKHLQNRNHNTVWHLHHPTGQNDSCVAGFKLKHTVINKSRHFRKASGQLIKQICDTWAEKDVKRTSLNGRNRSMVLAWPWK